MRRASSALQMSPLPSTGTLVTVSLSLAIADQSAVPRVELGCGAGVQRDGCHSGALGGAARLEVGEVVGVDALAHLDGERDVARRARGALDDLAEQPELPRQRRSPALARDLGHRAAEVEVDVVGAVFGDEHRDGLGDGLRVDPVELDAARRLRLVVRDEAHALGRALDERPARDHLGHVEAGAVLAAEPAERGVRDPRHRRQHDRHAQFERPIRSGAAAVDSVDTTRLSQRGAPAT